MNHLLKACARKYVKNKVFWLAILSSFVLGMMFGKEARRLYFDTKYIFFEFILMAVLFTWMIGREYEDGIFRNKVIAGLCRGEIFLAEVMIGIAAGVTMFVACGVGFSLYNGYVFAAVPISVLLRIMFNVLLVNIGMVILYITTHCVFTHKVLSFLICILLLFGIAIGSARLDSALRVSEYEEVLEMVETVDEDGNVQMELMHTGTVRNPYYLSGFARKFCNILYQVLPWTNLNNSVGIILGNFGYENFQYLYDSGMVFDNVNPAHFSMTEEEDEMLNCRWIYSVGFILAATSVGYVLFSRKEFQ